MTQYRLAALPGDGIGPEVVEEAKKCINRAAELFGFGVSWREFPFGADYYLAQGDPLPRSALDDLGEHDALLLGAIGDPRVPPGPLEHGILLTLRFHFDQFVNLRPALSLPGVPLPVALEPGTALDAVVVRENTEDFYMGIGGAGVGDVSIPFSGKRRLYPFSGRVDLELPDGLEAAFTLGLMSRPGIERITRYAFNLAKSRGERRVHVVSKANAVPHLYGFWDRVTRETAASEFHGMEYLPVNVDAACYLMPRAPTDWGVVLCPNLFGDIVSDLMSALAGGLGLAAAGNIGDSLSMFEPVHGSAPTIARTGRANPLAAILSAGLLLRHIGETEAAARVERAARDYLGSTLPKPIEQGGPATTGEVGDHIVTLMSK